MYVCGKFNAIEELHFNFQVYIILTWFPIGFHIKTMQVGANGYINANYWILILLLKWHKNVTL